MTDEPDDYEQNEQDEARVRRRSPARLRDEDKTVVARISWRKAGWLLGGFAVFVIIATIAGNLRPAPQKQASVPEALASLKEKTSDGLARYRGNAGSNSLQRVIPPCTAALADHPVITQAESVTGALEDKIIVCVQDLDNQYKYVSLPDVARIHYQRQQRLDEINKRADEDARRSGYGAGSGRGSGGGTTASGSTEKTTARTQLVVSFRDTAAPSTHEENRRDPVENRRDSVEKAAANTEKLPKIGRPCKGDPHCIEEGTTLPCVLENRIDASFAGPVKCLLREPVLSRDKELMFKDGTVILGTASNVSGPQQRRIVVGFHRIIRDDGTSIELAQNEVGLDAAGATALPAHIRRDWARAFGISLLLGSAAALQIGSGYSNYGYNPATEVRNNASREFAQQAQQMFPRNNLPVLTADEGSRIGVYIAHDLPIPPYASEEKVSESAIKDSNWDAAVQNWHRLHPENYTKGSEVIK